MKHVFALMVREHLVPDPDARSGHLHQLLLLSIAFECFYVVLYVHHK